MFGSWCARITRDIFVDFDVRPDSLCGIVDFKVQAFSSSQEEYGLVFFHRDIMKKADVITNGYGTL